MDAEVMASPAGATGDTESSRPERWWVAAIAVAAALPSLVAGLVGGGFLTDDWGVWLVFDRLGVLDGMWHLAFEQPARPLVAPYYAFIYLVVGDAPVVQSLIMAAVNASVVVAAWSCGRRFLPRTVMWPALVVFALAANHAMTRLWFIVATYPMAIALVFLGVRDLDRRHAVRASILLAAATLLYEGSVGLALTLVGLWALVDLSQRIVAAGLVLLPTIAAAVLAFLLSPKRELGPKPFNNVRTLYPGTLGVGLWDSALIARIGTLAILAGLLIALVQLLPSWRSEHPEGRWALVGLVLLFAGAGPFLLSGAPFATTGLFDRNNLAPAVGTAVLLGALWGMLHRVAAVPAQVLGLSVVLWFCVLQAEDVANYADAVGRGDAIVESLAAAPGVDDTEPILVVPAQESAGTGLADFVYDGDLTGAMRYRHGGDWSGVRLVENVECVELAAQLDEVQVFDWTSSTLTRAEGDEVRSLCELASSS
mgnify:CR=1 FL=1